MNYVVDTISSLFSYYIAIFPQKLADYYSTANALHVVLIKDKLEPFYEIMKLTRHLGVRC